MHQTNHKGVLLQGSPVFISVNLRHQKKKKKIVPSTRHEITDRLFGLYIRVPLLLFREGPPSGTPFFVRQHCISDIIFKHRARHMSSLKKTNLDHDCVSSNALKSPFQYDHFLRNIQTNTKIHPKHHNKNSAAPEPSLQQLLQVANSLPPLPLYPRHQHNSYRPTQDIVIFIAPRLNYQFNLKKQHHA